MTNQLPFTCVMLLVIVVITPSNPLSFASFSTAPSIRWHNLTCSAAARSCSTANNSECSSRFASSSSPGRTLSCRYWNIEAIGYKYGYGWKLNGMALSERREASTSLSDTSVVSAIENSVWKYTGLSGLLKKNTKKIIFVIWMKKSSLELELPEILSVLFTFAMNYVFSWPQTLFYYVHFRQTSSALVQQSVKKGINSFFEIPRGIFIWFFA